MPLRICPLSPRDSQAQKSEPPSASSSPRSAFSGGNTRPFNRGAHGLAPIPIVLPVIGWRRAGNLGYLAVFDRWPVPALVTSWVWPAFFKIDSLLDTGTHLEIYFSFWKTNLTVTALCCWTYYTELTITGVVKNAPWISPFLACDTFFSLLPILSPSKPPLLPPPPPPLPPLANGIGCCVASFEARVTIDSVASRQSFVLFDNRKLHAIESSAGAHRPPGGSPCSPGQSLQQPEDTIPDSRVFAVGS